MRQQWDNNQRASWKRGEVIWNKQHTEEKEKSFWGELCQRKVGRTNFTIYWLLNELFPFSSLQARFVARCLIDNF